MGRALKFGKQKINLHQAGAKFNPKAGRAPLASADLRFMSAHPPGRVLAWGFWRRGSPAAIQVR